MRARSADRLFTGAMLRLGEPLIAGRWATIWWIVLIRSVAAIAFGAVTLAWPRHTALALMNLFGSYALVDGLVALALSTRSRRFAARLSLSLGGAASVGAAALVFTAPPMAVLTLIRVMGLWLIMRGVTETVDPSPAASFGAPASWSEVKARRGSIIFNGGMCVAFGLGLIVAPRIGALGLMWAVGTWAVTHGVLMIPFALRLRRAETNGSEA